MTPRRVATQLVGRHRMQACLELRRELAGCPLAGDEAVEGRLFRGVEPGAPGNSVAGGAGGSAVGESTFCPRRPPRMPSANSAMNRATDSGTILAARRATKAPMRAPIQPSSTSTATIPSARPLFPRCSPG